MEAREVREPGRVGVLAREARDPGPFCGVEAREAREPGRDGMVSGTPVTNSIRRTGAGLDYGSIGLPPVILSHHRAACGLAERWAALQNKKRTGFGRYVSRGEQAYKPGIVIWA